MRLRHVSLGGLRVFAEAEFFPAPEISWLTGDNGAGKTTVLEGVFALAHARSFRSSLFETVLASGVERGHVFSEWVDASGVSVRLACARGRGAGWEYRIDGANVSRVAEIAMRAPMLCFEPGSHLWVAGPAERRRRLLDWGVFHVERGAPSLWSDWQRILRQRNEALRVRDVAQLDAFDSVLGDIGERLDRARRVFAERWLARCSTVLAWLSDGLGDVSLEYRRGWGRAHGSLLDALLSSRERDLMQGFTAIGPQRADVVMRLAGAELKDRLSRGQSKIVALSLMLSLCELHLETHRAMPLLLLDDLCSELDVRHASAVLAYLRERGAQVLITGVERPAWAEATGDAVFHVERGSITPLL